MERRTIRRIQRIRKRPTKKINSEKPISTPKEIKSGTCSFQKEIQRLVFVTTCSVTSEVICAAFRSEEVRRL